MAFLMRGERGGRVLICEGMRYTWYRQAQGHFEWRCWRRPHCRARVCTNIFDRTIENPDIVINRAIDDHVHPPDTDVVERAQLRQEMQAQALQDPTRPSRRVYTATLARHQRLAAQGGGDRPEFPPLYVSVRSAIERSRRSQLPPLPAELQDVQINPPWNSTWNERFLLSMDNDWGYVVYATDRNLQTLRRSRTIYIDGTFRTCPRPYSQTLTIIGDNQGHIVPLVHVMMANRTIGHYRQVLQGLKNEIRLKTHHRWAPRVIICDFELALRTALGTELPRSRIQGCYFHFKQSLWKRVQEFGLTVGYRNNQQLRRFVQKIMALGHLPLPLVRLNFIALRNAQRTRRLLENFDGLHDFLNYVNTNYLNPAGSFPPALWNVYGRGMQQRTNNNAEAYHRVLNEAVQVRHPSLWVFVRHLKDIQATTDNKITAAEHGVAPPRRRQKWRQLEIRLQRLREQYEQGARDLPSFWSAVAHLI